MKPAYDLLVRGARVVTPEGVMRAEVGVAGGRFVRIAPAINETAAETIDATGQYLFPGIIDSHVHFNEPGRTEWEGVATGSAALAAGGGTMFFDMPLNSLPPTIDAAAFALKRAAAERVALVDFSLWGGLVPGKVDRLEELRDAGAIGFKAFMCDSGVGEFPAANASTLKAGMVRAAALGCLVAVHAEDEFLARQRTEEQHAKGTGVRAWLASRPVELELTAIRTALDLAGETGCALHIVHVSSPAGVTLALEARARGVNVTVETCPHYLLLTDEDVVRLGAVAKCFPILRNETVRRGLWDEVEHGRVDTIGSDHSPAPPEMKRAEDFFAIWGGISGCQHGFPLMLSEAIARAAVRLGSSAGNAPGNAGSAETAAVTTAVTAAVTVAGDGRAEALALPRLAALLAANVAKRFQLDATKGRVAEGFDADFILLDTNSPRVLSTAELLYRHRQGPYDGRRSRVRVARTVVRGRTVLAEGRIADGPRPGQFVRP
jgi:allantoinase